MWDLACPDWADRIRQGRPLIPPLPLDKAEAARAVAIFNRLRVPDVIGQPSFAEAGGDWFRDIVAALFGSVDAETLERMLREIFVLVPKKNAKTTGGAALMLTALLMNRRPRAEFLLIGPTQDVSKLAFGQAVGMIDADPDGFLQKRMHVREHLKEIIDRKTRAVLKIKTFDPSVLTGVKPAGVLIDELHVMSAMADADRVIGQIRGGLLPNPEAFLVFITTQSERQPAGVFRAELMNARAVRDGTLKGVASLPVLYEFPPDIATDPEQWQDPKHWRMVTPNAGRSITIERLAQEFDRARATGEEEVRRWASQHLNIEIGLGLMSDRWAGALYWERRADPDLTFESLLQRSEVAVVGIDGGGMDDLLGLVVLGRERETRRWLCWAKAWVHECALARRKEIGPRLRDFQQQGDLCVIADDSDEDVQGVADIVEQVEAAGLLPPKHAIGVDPVGINEIVDELTLRGFDTNPETGRITGIRQGWTLSNTIQSTARGLAKGDIVHAGQPIMAWCVGNAKVEPRGNAIAVTKQTAGTAKIDPLMALLNASALMAMNPSAASAPVIYAL
jgi:phage terminase large subunit-like protein